jgi:hypothetical protein
MTATNDNMIHDHWTLDDGVTFARQLELSVIDYGYHIALGGSVLHKGESKKDLDIFVYPHTTEQCLRQQVMVALQLFGVKWLNVQCKHYHDDKIVRSGEYQNKRIDFFFLL